MTPSRARPPARPAGHQPDVVEAIAHPGRRALLRLVIDAERPVGQLAERIGLSQPATSQHLRILREAGLVQARVDGPRRLYRAHPGGLERLRRELDGFWPDALRALKQASEAGDWPPSDRGSGS